MNLSMCIKKHGHDSYHFPRKRKHVFWFKMGVNVKVSHATYKNHYNFNIKKLYIL
jgi:hypothetical protein